MIDLIHMANEATQAKNFEEAERCLDLAFKVGYPPEEVCGDDQSGIMNLALALGEEKRWADAMRLLKHAEEILPGFYRIVDYGWHFLVVGAAWAGEVDAAFNCFEHAPKGFGNYHFVLGGLTRTILEVIKKWNPAFDRDLGKEWDPTVNREISKDWLPNFGNSAGDRFRKNVYDKIERSLERVLEIEPDLKHEVYSCYLYVSLKIARSWDVDFAEKCFARARQLADPGDKEELDECALIFTQNASLNGIEHAKKLRNRS